MSRPEPIWVIDTEERTTMKFDGSHISLKSPIDGEVPLKQNDDYKPLDMSDPTVSVLVKCVAAFIDDELIDFMKPIVSKQHLAMFIINRYKLKLSTFDTTIIDLKILQACVFFISDNNDKIDGLVRVDMLTKLGKMITKQKQHIIVNRLNKDTTKIYKEIYMFDDVLFKPRYYPISFGYPTFLAPHDWNYQYRDAVIASMRGNVAHRITNTGRSLVNMMYGQFGMGKSVFSTIILDEFQNRQLLKTLQSKPPRQRMSKTRAYKQLVLLMKKMKALRLYYMPKNRAERRDEQSSHVALAERTITKRKEKIRRLS